MSEESELHTCPACHEADWHWIRLTKNTIACPHCGVVIYAVKAYDLSPKEAAIEVAKNLEKAGFVVKDIKNIEADIKWLREKGLV